MSSRLGSLLALPMTNGTFGDPEMLCQFFLVYALRFHEGLC